MVAADGAEGRWALEDLHPAACAGAQAATLTVHRAGFALTEAACAFAAPAPEGFFGMIGPVRCEGGGARSQVDVDLMLDGERLLLAVGGGSPLGYRRC